MSGADAVEQRTELRLLVGGQGSDQHALSWLVPRAVLSEQVRSLRREADEHATSVVVVRGAPDQSLGLQTVDQPADRRACHRQQARQHTGLKALVVGRGELGEHREGARRQPERAQLRCPLGAHATGGLLQPVEHVRRDSVVLVVLPDIGLRQQIHG